MYTIYLNFASPFKVCFQLVYKICIKSKKKIYKFVNKLLRKKVVRYYVFQHKVDKCAKSGGCTFTSRGT